MKNKLFQSLILGDAEGIQKIYDLVFPKVLRFIRKNSGGKDDAKDVFQEALIQLISRFKVNDLHLDISIESYLFTVCKNLWRQELNRRKRVTKQKENTYIAETSSTENFEDELIQKKRELYERKFNELSDNCKSILTLFYKKVSYQEMIKTLSYSNEATARQRVFKCRKKLSELIRKDPLFSKIRNYYD